MNPKPAAVSLALAGALTTALAAITTPAFADGPGKEKCYGVSLKRLRGRPRHDARRDVQGRLPGQRLAARSKGHLYHHLDAARPRFARPNQARLSAASVDADGGGRSKRLPSPTRPAELKSRRFSVRANEVSFQRSRLAHARRERRWRRAQARACRRYAVRRPRNRFF